MSGVALVTGGQQGIGLAIAEALAGAGFALAIAAEAEPDAPAVTTALARLPSARYHRHDLTRDDPATLLDTVEADIGPVTTLISNAGVPAKMRGDMLDLTPESFDLVHAVNLRGGFFLAQTLAKRMLSAPADFYRSMVFVTSASAGLVSIERAEYCISKAGASMMASLFAARLAPHGIGVFELRPGIIRTAMTAPVEVAYTARIEAGLVPARRWGEPADVAAAVLPLVEGRMAYATGAVLPIDGGLAIPRL